MPWKQTINKNYDLYNCPFIFLLKTIMLANFQALGLVKSLMENMWLCEMHSIIIILSAIKQKQSRWRF